MLIKEIFKIKKTKKIKIKGWIISNRGNKNVRFLIVNDGSCFENIQVVLKEKQALIFEKAKLGSAISIEGQVKFTPNSQQEIEIISEDSKLLKNVDDDFPLQKKEISLEFLRSIPHLRHRTKYIRAIMNIRSTLFFEIHKFFRENNFLNVASPIITSNDGEGAGEAFVVDSEEKNFFNRKATLSVTGQLHAESYANGFGRVYTFAPTFRAEKSNTQHHAAEFWMLEPEVAFCSKLEMIKIAEKMLKQVIANTLKINEKEFDFFEKNIKERLIKFINSDLNIINYKTAIKYLEKNKNNFLIKDIHFGMDLAKEHEKYLCDAIFKGPVAVTDFPKKIKAFYMKQNNDNETVAAFDILVPEIGELIGGSERETDYKKLSQRSNELKIKQKDIQWYLDLRRFGHFQSSGFGLGFERLIMYVTGAKNIRDSIPFPRTNNNLKM